MHEIEEVKPRRRLMVLSLVINLGLLGVFKYFNFFADSFRQLFASLGMELDRVTLDVILPVGISFYTFQTLSYTIDIYRRKLEPERRLIDFALFVSFFPQLVAGPIERAAHLLPQVRNQRRVTGEDIAHGLWYVNWGLFLKVFVADNLGPIADRAFDPTNEIDGFTSLLGVYAFAFQIFGDFAGYSSIAIGSARMLGFRLSTNFLFPYWVTNPRDFWRNWHISLSTWLRDYLYIPLGGGRGSRWNLARNLMLTMLLGGLWHGAAWTFVLWGVFHGGLLIAHRVVEALAGSAKTPASTASEVSVWALKVIVMFQLTCLGWLLFRAPSLDQFGAMLTAIMTTLHWPTESQVVDGLYVVFYAWPVLAIQAIQISTGSSNDLSRLAPWMRVSLSALMLYALLIWGDFGGSPFIYFQF